MPRRVCLGMAVNGDLQAENNLILGRPISRNHNNNLFMRRPTPHNNNTHNTPTQHINGHGTRRGNAHTASECTPLSEAYAHFHLIFGDGRLHTGGAATSLAVGNERYRCRPAASHSAKPHRSGECGRRDICKGKLRLNVASHATRLVCSQKLVASATTTVKTLTSACTSGDRAACHAHRRAVGQRARHRVRRALPNDVCARRCHCPGHGSCRECSCAGF